jgi:hypothetical protein
MRCGAQRDLRSRARRQEADDNSCRKLAKCDPPQWPASGPRCILPRQRSAKTSKGRLVQKRIERCSNWGACISQRFETLAQRLIICQAPKHTALSIFTKFVINQRDKLGVLVGHQDRFALRFWQPAYRC